MYNTQHANVGILHGHVMISGCKAAEERGVMFGDINVQPTAPLSLSVNNLNESSSNMLTASTAVLHI